MCQRVGVEGDTEFQGVVVGDERYELEGKNLVLRLNFRQLLTY